MIRAATVSIALVLLGLAACSDRPAGDAGTGADASPAAASEITPSDPREPAGAIAVDSKAELTLEITWTARLVSDREFKDLTVLERRTTLVCPLTAGDRTSVSLIDGSTATGEIQPWFNEGCRGSMTVADSRKLDDPTIAGEEPTIHTSGTSAIETRDTLVTVETDLAGNATRYMIVAPTAEGFMQEAGYGETEKRVSAAAMPEAVVIAGPFRGPVQDGSHRFAVAGGDVSIRWTFRRL